MRLEHSKTYIFDKQPRFYSAPFKGEVIDVTLHTYLIKNLDTERTIRYDKKEFEETWTILETIKNNK